jgi:hypothetical protein
MTEVIEKPDANPVLAAVVAVFFDLGHVVVNGQSRKWVFTTVVVHVGLLLCCLPGVVLRVLSVMDAYETARRLQAGEAIPENEYSQPLLFKIVRMIDKSATCSRA